MLHLLDVGLTTPSLHVAKAVTVMRPSAAEGRTPESGRRSGRPGATSPSFDCNLVSFDVQIIVNVKIFTHLLKYLCVFPDKNADNAN